MAGYQMGASKTPIEIWWYTRNGFPYTGESVAGKKIGENLGDGGTTGYPHTGNPPG